MIGCLSRWIATLAIAFVAGKLMAKIKMPSILGWLIVGMLLGVSFTAVPASFPLSDLKISLQPETYSLLISQQYQVSGNSKDPADRT